MEISLGGTAVPNKSKYYRIFPVKLDSVSYPGGVGYLAQFDLFVQPVVLFHSPDTI